MALKPMQWLKRIYLSFMRFYAAFSDKMFVLSQRLSQGLSRYAEWTGNFRPRGLSRFGLDLLDDALTLSCLLKSDPP